MREDRAAPLTQVGQALVLFGGVSRNPPLGERLREGAQPGRESV